MIRDHTGNDVLAAVSALKTALKDKLDDFEIDGTRDYGCAAAVMRLSDHKVLHIARVHRFAGDGESYCLEPDEVLPKLKEIGWI